jgi:hypothetical protein
MTRLLMVCFLFVFFHSFAFSDLILAGRSKDIDVSFWTMNSNKVGEKIVIQERAEVFAVIKVEETLYLGGTLNTQGCVWEKNLKTGEVNSTFLKDSAFIYSLCNLPNNTLVAAGTHPNLGGGIWRKTKGGPWSDFEAVPKSTVISCLTLGSDEILFAGGSYRGKGKVWIWNQNFWSQGEYLNQAKEINTLCFAKGIVYAGGQKEPILGGLWEFNGKTWNTGTDLKFSNAIYASTVNKNGAVYLAGAGSKQKSIWENGDGFWNAISLDSCLSIYAIHTDTNGLVCAAGWNNKRTGSAWIQDTEKKWSQEVSIADCFVVRGIA